MKRSKRIKKAIAAFEAKPSTRAIRAIGQAAGVAKGAKLGCLMAGVACLGCGGDRQRELKNTDNLAERVEWGWYFLHEQFLFDLGCRRIPADGAWTRAKEAPLPE